MRLLLTLALLVFCCACKRNELCYDHPHGGVRVEVVWDKLPEELQQILPEAVCTVFYPEAQSGSSDTYTYYRGCNGGDVTIPDGIYDVLVFNSDTEMILFRGMEKLETAEAYLAERTRQPYTSRGDADDKRISYSPDSKANVLTRSLPLIREPDRFFASGLIAAEVTAGKMQDWQSFQIYPESRVVLMTVTIPVKNLGDARSCRASLSGAARSVFLGQPLRGEDTGTIIFDMQKQDEEHLTQTICTFGLNRSPEGTPSGEAIQHILQLEFVMKDNTVKAYEFDIGQQIDFDNMAPEVEIPVKVEDGEIELPEVEESGGGFEAVVDGWGEQIDIYL